MLAVDKICRLVCCCVLSLCVCMLSLCVVFVYAAKSAPNVDMHTCVYIYIYICIYICIYLYTCA